MLSPIANPNRKVVPPNAPKRPPRIPRAAPSSIEALMHPIKMLTLNSDVVKE
jgi:hypothetical protein